MSEAGRHQAIAQVEKALRAADLLDFSGEVQLLEWSKSTSRDGPKVKLLLPDDDAVVPFEAATVKKGRQAGQLYHLFAIRIDEDARTHAAAEGAACPASGGEGSAVPAESPAAGKPSNALARDMHVNGYFRNAKLWKAMHDSGFYTWTEHKQWVESLPCLRCSPLQKSDVLRQLDLTLAVLTRLMGRMAHIQCKGDVCLHHTPGAGVPAAGPGSEHPRKPPHFYGVPLCWAHHNDWAHGTGNGGAKREDKEALRELAVALTAYRIKGVMKIFCGIDSMSQITQGMVDNFEKAVGYRD